MQPLAATRPPPGSPIAALLGVLLAYAVLLPPPLPRPLHPLHPLHPAAARAQAPPSAPTGTVLVHAPFGAASARRLRADFEPIDVLALVYMPDWHGSVEHIIEQVADDVDIHLVALDDGSVSRRFARWARGMGVRLSYLAHDTPWIRDYGPLQLFDGPTPLWLDFGYSDERRRDDALPRALARTHRATMHGDLMHLDGGGLVSDGDGLCVTTAYTLEDTGLRLQDAEQLAAFVAHIGCRLLAVVPRLREEETGHIDLSVQFLTPERVAVAEMDPHTHPQQAAVLDATAGAIAAAAAQLGRRMQVVRVPMRAHRETFYSYLNGTRVGARFLVPTYGDVPPAEEARAHGILAASMPGVRLVPVDADAMVALGGAIHCITVGLNLRPRAHARAPAAPRRPRLRPPSTPRRARAKLPRRRRG